MIFFSTTDIRKIKLGFLIATIGVLILAGTLIYSYQYNLIVNQEHHNIEVSHDHVHRTYDLLLNELQNDLSMHSNLLLKSDELRSALAQQDRQTLYKLSSSAFELLRIDNPYLKIMTFRLPDGTTLLRLHKPQMYGDSLHPSRSIIIDTNAKQVPYSGFEVGKLKMDYRFLTPIFYHNAYVGSLEMGVDPEYIINTLKKLFDIKYALLIESAHTAAALQFKQLGKIGDFLLVNGDPLFLDKLTDISLNNPDPKIRYHDQTYVIKDDMNLLNNRQEVVGKILLGFNIDALSMRTDRLLRNTLLFTTALILALSLILHFGFNYFITRLARTQKELQELNHTLESKVQSEMEKNRKQEQHMFHQSRLAQMGELLSMIAHQWRQPLAYINAVSANIRLKFELDDFELNTQSGQTEMLTYTQEQLGQIEKCVMNLSNTIENFKDFYKPSRQKMSHLLHEPVQRALEMLDHTFKSKEIHYKEEYLETSQTQLHFNEVTQVILNLLQNAMDEFLERHVKNPTITLRTRSDENNLFIEVCNNGKKIDAHIAEKVFEPYFSTKENKNGSGLGLYMSKMIIEDHHSGKLYLDEYDHETCFVISLPKKITNT